MLKHASRSRHIDPDRAPAAAGGLRSQFPDLVHGPRELLDCRQLQRRLVDERTDPRRLRQEVEGGHRLGSFSYHTGPSEPQLTSSGRATHAEWLSSTHQTTCHGVQCFSLSHALQLSGVFLSSRLLSSVIGTYACGIVNRGTRRSVRVRRDSALRSSTLRIRTCHQYTHSLPCSLHVGGARDTDTHDTKHRQTHALLQVATRYADTECIASCTLAVERRGESRAREPWSVLGSAFREGPAAHGEEDHE